MWRRKRGREAERGLVLEGIKRMELIAGVSLKIVIAIVTVLQRKMRGNAVWDAQLYAAMKAFSK